MSWFTKKQAADYLSVSVSTIDNMESAGMLEPRRVYLKPGAKRAIVRYRQEDLDTLFLRRQKGRPRQTEMIKRFDSVYHKQFGHAHCEWFDVSHHKRFDSAHHMPNL